MTDHLTEFAADQQRQFDEATAPSDRKARGHFGTHPAVAEFMAGMFREMPPGATRILDPGAGVGTLSAAVCQRVVGMRSARHLYFELWENDPKLEPYLRRTMERCRAAMLDAGHEMEFVVKSDDFLLDRSGSSLFDEAPDASFDLAITNPPYFKLRKDDPSARAMAHVVHGQPNIYALFLAAAADRLRDGGCLVAITPRSYFNGPYFKRFRRWFFDRMTARHIHVFESRSDAFREGDVLQENVILLAEKGARPENVVLTTSHGRDLREVDRHLLPYGSVIDDAGDRVVRVTAEGLDQEVVEAIDRLPGRFRDLPFRVSTGPVVTFRSREHLRDERSADTAPLLWMHNVRPFVTRFPPKNGKPTHIHVGEDSKRLLVPARRYVLLKRFTAKEERRRLVAGIVAPGDSYSPVLGLENHLNYVYRPDGELSADEALGLAALFNSAMVDRYFRAISGNTQVNATELRALPMPGLESIRAIGRTISGNEHDPGLVERTVGEALGVPESLTRRLSETAP